MTHIETLKLALDFISRLKFADAEPEPDKVMEALRQAIAEAEQAQPVAYVDQNGVLYHAEDAVCVDKANILTPLYTPPPPRQPWVGLTDEEREAIADEYQSSAAAALMSEAKLKEKNT